jgi:hypothetical protein
LQVGFIGAGVARGAQFTDALHAVLLGAGIVVALESAKIIGGWLDHRLGAIEAHQQAYGDTNPYQTRPLQLQEEIVAKLDKLITVVSGLRA